MYIVASGDQELNTITQSFDSYHANFHITAIVVLNYVHQKNSTYWAQFLQIYLVPDKD